MASGNLYSSNVHDTYGYISWKSVAGSGGSTVTATLGWYTTYGYYFNNNKGCSLTINGSTVTGKKAVSGSGSFTFLTHSVWVPYTGNKSISISGNIDLTDVSYSGGGKLPNYTISGTATLDRVGTNPTVPTCTAPTTQYFSEQGGTITISWTKTSSYNGTGGYYVDLQKDGGSWGLYKQITNIDTLSTTYTIPAGVGHTYRFRIGAYNDVGNAGDHGYSGIVTQNSISPPTIGDLPIYNPYVTSVLTVPLSGGSQADGSTFKRMADLYYGTEKLASCTTPANNNTSVNITYSSTNFASKLGATKYTDTFKIVAWSQNSSGSKSGTIEKTFTVGLNSDGGATPTLSEPTFSGGILDNPSTCFVSGITDLIVTSATAVKRRAASTVTLSYKIDCTGATSINSSSGTFKNLSGGTKTITVTVTDSRGLKTSITKQCVFQNYALPTIKNFKVERLENPNTSGKATYTISYSPIYQYPSPTTQGVQLNDISVQQMSKSGAAYVNYTSGTAITDLATGLTYKIDIRIADKVKPTTYVSASDIIPTIKSAFSIRRWGVGINCIPQNGIALDVVGKTNLFGDFTINGDGTITSTHNTSSWYNGATGQALLNSNNTKGGYTALIKANSTNGRMGISSYQNKLYAWYVSDATVNAQKNQTDQLITLIDESGDTVVNQLFAETNIKAKNGYLMSLCNGKQVQIGSINENYCHYNTTASQHWFNTDVCVQGNVYAGSNYQRRLAFVDECITQGYCDILTSTNSQIACNGATMITLYGNGGVDFGNSKRPDGTNTGILGWRINLLANGGGINSNTTINNTSDKRLKKNIEDIPDVFVNIWLELQPKVFEYTYMDGKKQFGLIAQDVIETFEKYDIDYKDYGFIGTFTNENNEEYFSLSYDNYSVLTALVLKHIINELNELKQTVNS